jgi:hypothetical protein
LPQARLLLGSGRAIVNADHFNVRPQMKTLRFFTIPTVLGWLAALITCMVIHVAGSVLLLGIPLDRAVWAAKDYSLALTVGCALIVLPTYISIICPMSLLDYRRVGKRTPIAAGTYIMAILAAGVVLTAGYASLGMTDIGWAINKVDQILFFFLPFIPYALVVTAVAKSLIPKGIDLRA